MRSLNQESDKRVLQISQLHGRQTGNRSIRIRLPDRPIGVLRMTRSSKVTAEHVRDARGQRRRRKLRRKLIIEVLIGHGIIVAPASSDMDGL